MTKHEIIKKVSRLQVHDATVVDVYTVFTHASIGQLTDMVLQVEMAVAQLLKDAGGKPGHPVSVEAWGKFGCRVVSVVHLPTSTVYRKHGIKN